jgi:hypothetical protein
MITKKSVMGGLRISEICLLGMAILSYNPILCGVEIVR